MSLGTRSPFTDPVPPMSSQGYHPNRIDRPRLKVLLPQRSENFALRRVSDFSSSEIRALDTLNRYRPNQAVPSALHQVNRESGSSSEAETSSKGSIEQTPSQSKNRKQDTELTTPSTRLGLTNSNTTGQFLFLDEQTSHRGLLRSESDNKLLENPLPQVPKATEPVLGTKVLAAKMNSAQIPNSMLALRDDSSHVANPMPSLGSAPSPAAPLEVPDAQQQIALDSIQDVARASNLSIPVTLSSVQPRKRKRRRRVIQRARKLLLRRRVLSILLGRDIASIVHTSLDVTNGATQAGKIPNLDGTIQPMMSMTPFVVAQMVSNSSDSPLSTPTICSRRNSQAPPMDLDGRTYEQMQLMIERPSTGSKSKSKAFAKKDQSQTLVGKVKSLKAGEKLEPVPDHRPGSLAAGVHAFKQRKSWRNRFQFRTPKVKVLGSLFKRRRSEQKASSWKFWKNTGRAVKRDSHCKGP